MALRESYASNLKNLKHGSRVFVMRHRGHDHLAPQEDLFTAFKKREAELKKAGHSPVDAHNRAWDEVDYENRFAAAFWKNPAAVAELAAIRDRAKHENVFLICYEKPPKKCHRHLLLEFARKLPSESRMHRKVKPH